MFFFENKKDLKKKKDWPILLTQKIIQTKHTQLGNPTWLGFKLIYVWAMIPTLGLNRPLWIGGKPLTYSKPIIGNGIDCELVGWTSKDFGPNGASTFPLITNRDERDKKNQVKCMKTKIK